MAETGLKIRFARTDDVRLAAKAPAHWRQKATAKRFAKDRNQELVAGGLLVEMLSLPELKVAVDSAGKPFLSDRPDVHFSISHSDEVVMCVVSDHPVGCDVEKIVPIDDDLRKAIGSIAAWTLKEARFKCGATAGEPRAVSAPGGYCAAVAEG